MISSIPCTRQRRPLSVCILGQHNCGKTSLINSFGTNADSHYRPKSSYGVSFENCYVVLENGMNVKFEVQEIAGFQCFNSTATHMLANRQVDACVVMFDITQKESFEFAKSWVEFLKQSNLQNMLIFLVGNKKDLPSRQRNVTTDVCKEAAIFAESYDISYAETSSKRPKTAKKLFTNIANQCYHYHGAM